jgi:hypothetical protein
LQLRLGRSHGALPRFYLPGTGSYDAERAKELRRQRREANQALKSARRAKAGPETIRKAKQRSARIERELAKVAARQQERARLSEDERRAFNRLGIGKQNYFLAAGPDYRDPVLQLLIEYPDDPPPTSVPDPFASLGERRNPTWTLYYKTLAKKKRPPKRMRQAA